MANLNYHLAQLNIAKSKKPLDDPLLADFVSELDKVNAAGESSPGFVWRFTEDIENPLITFRDPLIIVNLTVWESMESLMTFAYRNPEHVAVFKKRAKWFEEMNP